ncbi:MAG: ferredoxin [Thermodesulforhabdaceae bacterium]
MPKKIVIDAECCVGCGTCQELCPEVFKLDEASEKSTVIKPEGGSECVEDAIRSCPGECISWAN